MMSRLRRLRVGSGEEYPRTAWLTSLAMVAWKKRRLRAPVRIRERHLLEFFVGLREGFAAFGDGLFEPEAFALQFARTVIHEEIESEDAQKNGQAARVPALPPGRNHGEGKFRREAEGTAGGAAGDGEVVIAGRKRGIASFAAGSFIRFSFEARQPIRATDIFWVAVGESREVHVERIIAAQSLGFALADAVARAELCGGDHDLGRKLDTLVGRNGIIAREAAAGAEQQGAVPFRKKATFAKVVPDEAIGARIAQSVALAGKFGEAKGAAGPDVAFVIGPEHVDVERRKPVRQAIVSEPRFSIHEAQATETQSVGVAEPDLIAADGSGFHNFVLQQTVGRREVQPLLAIEARKAAPAHRPYNSIAAGSEPADALVDFRRQRNIHEMKRALRKTSSF